MTKLINFSEVNPISNKQDLIIKKQIFSTIKKCINMFMKKQNKKLFINKTLRMTALELI